MKKMLSFALILGMAVALVACGGSSASVSSDSARWLDRELVVEDDLSGGGDVIGQYAYITVTADELKAITSEEISEFAETKVAGSDYNRVGILADDGTGLCFSGVDILRYGEITEECMIQDTFGTYFLGADGTYSE